MIDDLRPGREPDTLMGANIFEPTVESADSVRHADDEGMEADRHDPPGLRALAIEHVELAFDHGLELFGGATHADHRRKVVDLPGIGDRADRPSADIHPVGLIVVDPVGDVVGAVVDQVVEGVPALLQPGRQPAARTRAGRRLDPVEHALHGLALGLGFHVMEVARVALVMPHELPVERLGVLDDLGIVVADLAVQRHGAAHAVAFQHFHDAEHADPGAVIPGRPVNEVGRHPGTCGHRLVEREDLDIGDHPDREPGAAGPGELRPAVDGNVGKGPGAARLHRRSPVGFRTAGC